MKKLPKVSLGYCPTPFEELKRLSDEIGGPRIWIKRDDLTGLSFGGSKTRSLETLIGQAVEEGADTIITCGPMTSNHVRLTAAAANKLGLSAILVLKNDDKMNKPQGNMLLNTMLGAELVFANVDTLAELEDVMADLAVSLRKKGAKPFIIPGGGYSPVGAAGYLTLMAELLEQSKANNITIDSIIFAAGSGCTQSGLIVGNKYYNAGIEIIGLTINREKEVLIDRIHHDVVKTFSLLELDLAIEKDEVNVLDDYLGPAYAVPSDEGLKAIDKLARLEGVILDPCYTGKAMAGVIDLASRRFNADQNIVFIHTGGSPGVFTYSETLSSLQKKT